MPSAPISEADARLLRARPPASGAWRDGDPVGDRKFVQIGTVETEASERIPHARISYESFGELKVVAEGVETQAQMDFLKLQRCDEIQGYLISPPVPAEQFAELLRAQAEMC